VRFTAERDGLLKIFEDLRHYLYQCQLGLVSNSGKEPVMYKSFNTHHHFNRNFLKVWMETQIICLVTSPEMVRPSRYQVIWASTLSIPNQRQSEQVKT
jgi:hypothetical protein